MKDTNIDTFYEHLEKNIGFPKKRPDEVIVNWNLTETMDFVFKCKELLPTSVKNSTSMFDFVANSSLSGARYPCIGFECRLSRVDTLSRFASLYSDSVLIHDPFSSINPNHQIEDFENHVKYELLLAIATLLHLKPLVRKGIVGFASSEFHFCQDCYQTHIKDMVFERNKSKISTLLKERILREVSFKAIISHDTPVIEAEGPEDLVNHGSVLLLLSENSGDELLELAGRKANAKNSSFFSKKDVQKYRLFSAFVSPVIADLTIQNYYSELHGTQYVTDNEVDFALLSTANHSRVNRLSNALAEGLSHSVPYLADIEISKLLELREKEGESFNVYRDSFSEAIRLSEEPNADKIRQVFDDIVRPELNNINLTIKNSQKLLWGALTKDVVFGAGFITVGLFSGLLPPNIGEIVAALGGFNFVSSSLDKISKLVQEPSEIRNNKYYFLWKAKKQ
jgi:hypothetical protein